MDIVYGHITFEKGYSELFMMKVKETSKVVWYGIEGREKA